LEGRGSFFILLHDHLGCFRIKGVKIHFSERETKKMENKPMIPEERIMSKIYVIRGRNVMLDMDLAELYAVDNKQLKRAVRRNISRFPPDFMFVLNFQLLVISDS
jgi:CRISPR/Cas system-associated exonuclease Cas4 (RecB family)